MKLIKLSTIFKNNISTIIKYDFPYCLEQNQLNRLNGSGFSSSLYAVKVAMKKKTL